MISVIDNVMGPLANKFKFGIHTKEDIIQEGRRIAWKAIVEKYDGKRPLENFLRVHLRNRIINFKRDNNKHDEPAYLEGEPLGAGAANTEMMEKIDRELPVEYRADYLRLRDGVGLPKYRQ